jgi:hypothetical protein
MPRDEPNETSPLLGAGAVATTYVESGEAVAGALPTGSGIESHAHASTPAKTIRNVQDSDAAREAETGQEAGQYEGLPEVRKQLKCIVPAISVGVFLVAADQTLVASSAGKIGSDLNALKNTSWVATSYVQLMALGARC